MAKKANPNIAMKRRQYFIGGFFAIFAAALGVKAYTVQIAQSAYLQDQGERRYMREQKVKARRGNIYDRWGEPLAVSTPVDAIGVIPSLLAAHTDDGQAKRAEKSASVVRLAKALGYQPARLAKRIDDAANAGRHFILLKRQLDPRSAQEIIALDIAGVQTRREYRRYYPAAHVAGQLIGFTNIDNVGQEGIEISLDAQIRGRDGSKQVIRNSAGKLVEEVAMVEVVEHGKLVQLSTDLRIQTLLDHYLLQSTREFGASTASAVLVDAYTGEVLALSNVPQLNVNDTSERKPANFKNRAITDVFEPGSTMKPLVIAKALEEGKIQRNSQFDTNPGYIRIPGGTIKDTKNHKVLDTAGVVVKSSNVAMAMLAEKFSGQELTQFFRQLGFGQTVQSMVRGESAGILHNRAKWRPIERATLSFGYGLSVNILQLAKAYTVFANEGRIVPLTFLKRDKPIGGTRVFEESTIKMMLPILEDVTSKEGTAWRARVEGYRVGGKTGTTHLLEDGHYVNEYTSIFVGLAPIDNPRYVMAIAVNRPQEAHYGGTVAAPVFARTMKEALRMLHVVPKHNSGLVVAGGRND